MGQWGMHAGFLGASQGRGAVGHARRVSRGVTGGWGSGACTQGL
jgi:hypothetical protein